MVEDAIKNIRVAVLYKMESATTIHTEDEVEVAGRVKTRWNARTMGKMDTTHASLGQIKEKARRRFELGRRSSKGE